MSADPPGATCARCGRTAPAPPSTWTRGTDPVRGQGPALFRWLCGACTREHVRAIEARLDEAWW